MKLLNTLTNKKEEFKPIHDNEVRMYICGPTVYNYMHLGNVRPLVIFDVLRRYFLEKGYDVKFVSNFTDVDDKIIKRANEENTSIKEVTDRTIESVKEDLKLLKLYENPVIHPTCTAHMKEIIRFIDELIEKGYAYEKDGNVYFRVRLKEDYGKLSKKNIEELESGARVSVNEDKEDPLDFLLWKAKKENEPFWDSPWGEGRPGWHIECSAMAKEILGETLDIHGGGEDLTFPHHENEIAQSESLNNKPFANFWLHNGMINLDNVKMSKSKGNFFYARDFMKKESPEVLRFFIVNAHYRKPVNFTEESIESAKKALKKIDLANDRLNKWGKDLDSEKLSANDEAIKKLKLIEDSFINHMEDDLDTPDAITDWFNLCKFIQKNYESRDPKLYNDTRELFDKFVRVLGIHPKEENEKEDDSLDGEILKLINEREEARKNKNFALADSIRDDLLKRGILLKDKKDGVI